MRVCLTSSIVLICTVAMVCCLLAGSPVSAEMPDTLASFRATEPNTEFGRRVIPLGDQNNDGFDDIMISLKPSRAFLFYGGQDPDSTPVLTIDSVNPRISEIGDVNDDGFYDIVALGRSNFGWKLGLYHGGPLMDSSRDAWFGWDTLTASNWAGYGTDLNSNGINELVTGTNTWTSALVFDLGSDMDSIPEYVLRPAIEPYDGYILGDGLITGDFNGDGETDLVVSLRRQYSQALNGSLLLYWGGPAADTLPDMVIRRVGDFQSGYQDFGMLLVNIRDVNGDGDEDIFAAAGRGNDTTAFVYFGGPDIDTLPDLTLPCNPLVARRGGDLNSDSFDDIIISHHLPFSALGWVYVYYGGPTIDSIPDIEIQNSDFPDYQVEFGADCPGVGDFNGDGIDDFAISMIDVWHHGMVYIFSGPGPGTDVEEDAETTLPSAPTLRQNYPNPFNPSTTIEFDLPRRSRVTLTVYNILGRDVARLVNCDLSAGTHRVTWDRRDDMGRTASSGVYLYKLTTDEYSQTRKMVLLK